MKNKLSLFLSNCKSKFSFLKNINSLFYYFLFLLVVGIIFFAVSLFTESFSTSFTGDYTSQGISFYFNLYDDWWHFVRTGSFRYFDMNTYLGVNNLGSNGFYSLTDPFFFIVMIFPRSWMIQVMAFSTIFRMSLAGLVFYFYLRYMGVSDRSSRITGLAYAYCGWTAWYLWFTNFTENALTFVLILWGIEKVLREKKPWLLAFGIFVSATTNFFFMICFVMMGFIYAMWRYFQRLKQNTAKDNLIIISLGFAGFFVGLLLSCVVVLPAVYISLNAPRVVEATYLDSLKNFLKTGDFKMFFNYISSWKNVDSKLEYRKYFPIIDFFYPAMTNRGTPLTVWGNESYDNVAGSIFSYFPFIILLIPALIRSLKKKNFWPLVAIVLFIISLYTPFFYYLFFGFTKPYSRWTIFVTTSLLAYVGEYLDHIKEEPKWTLFVGGVFALVGAIASAGLASNIINTVSSMSQRFELSLVVTLECAYIIVLTLIIYLVLNKKFFSQIMFLMITLEAGVMGALVIEGHGVTTYESINYGVHQNNALIALTHQLNAKDKSFFRATSTLAGDSGKNDGMRNDYNGVAFFHSLYNFETANFSYESMLITSLSSWSGRYVEKRQGLDKFLGLKYYFIEKDKLVVKTSYDGATPVYETVQPNVPHDFVDVSSEYNNKYFNTYMDADHIDFAFSYDSLFIRDPDENTLPLVSTYGKGYSDDSWLALRNDELYSKGAILSKKDTEEVLSKTNDLTVKDIYSTTNSDAQFIYNASLLNPLKKSAYETEGFARNLAISRLTFIMNQQQSVNLPARNDDCKYFIVYQAKDGQEFPYDPEGMTFYINASFQNNRKENIYILDENDKVITWDNHMDDRNTVNSLRTGPRGFYVRKDPKTGVAPKVKTIMIVPRWNEFNTRDHIKYESYTTYKQRIDALKEHPITDVRYKDNHFDFKTNFESDRFVCTQVAFDNGWSVYAKDSSNQRTKLKTYNTQGGFVGFIAPKGEMTYEMDYYPPYLKLGTYLSLTGLILFSSSLLAYMYIDLERNKKKLLSF